MIITTERRESNPAGQTCGQPSRHAQAQHPSRIVYRAYTGPVEVGKKRETAGS
jgi:hypothetical protein